MPDGLVKRAMGVLVIVLSALFTVLMWSGVSIRNLWEMIGF
jgi:hypothetical protein